MISTENFRCNYDLNGNLISKATPDETVHFAYDHLDRLIKVTKPECIVEMSYDPLDRRVSKIVHNAQQQVLSRENYLYDGNNEIGAYSVEANPMQLRILGLSWWKDAPSTVAVELDGQVYVPLHDLQGNICRLVDTTIGQSVCHTDFSPFGDTKIIDAQVNNPWRFASKRFDFESGLVYFGKRFYDSDIARWMTTDPAGFIDSANLYQYVFNNPLKYTDPDGRFVATLLLWGAELALPSLSAFVAPIIYGSLTCATAYAGYKFSEIVNDLYHAQELHSETVAEELEKKSKRKPQYDGKELGKDPSRCPGEGFKWKGKGVPGSGKGSWVKGEGKGKEVLYPDLDHPLPIGPHWDYNGVDYPTGVRLFPNGTYEVKL